MKRELEKARNAAEGRPGDVDFQRMIRSYREECVKGREQPHSSLVDGKENEKFKDYSNGSSSSSTADNSNKQDEDKADRICIAVRKRPINNKEVKKH